MTGGRGEILEAQIEKKKRGNGAGGREMETNHALAIYLPLFLF